MARDVKSRTQRRMEKKQALLLLVLMLAVSLVSFSLGVMVGKSGSPPAQPAVVRGEPERMQVVKEDPPPPARPTTPAQPPVAEPVEVEKPPLTFFDTLPRGQEPPLGTGINRAPAAPVPRQADAPALPLATAAPAPPAPAPVATSAPAPAVSAEGRLVVQAGSFRAAEDARSLRDRLARKDYPAFVQQVDLGDRGIWHRVRIGPYAESAEAQAVAARLKAEERIDAFVANR
jgi:DedD protein